MAESLATRVCSLPIFPGMSEDHARVVGTAVRELSELAA